MKKKQKSISEHNLELYQSFMLTKEKENKGTQRHYTDAIERAMEIYKKPWEEMTELDARKIIKHIRKKKNEWKAKAHGVEYHHKNKNTGDVSESTEGLKAIKFKTFMTWINEQQGNDGCPRCVKWIKASNYKNPQITKEEIFTGKEIQTIIKKSSSIRDKAFFSGLYTTACRDESEFLKLKWSDITINLDNSIASAKVQQPKTRRKGKTHKDVYFTGSSFHYLMKWKNETPNDRDEVWLSLGKNTAGQPIKTPTSFNLKIKRIAEQNNIPKTRRLSCHNFRRARARHLNLRGTPPQIIYEMMGWSEITGAKMNAVYSKMDSDDTLNQIIKDEGSKTGTGMNKEKMKTLQEYDEITTLSNCNKCGREIVGTQSVCECGAVFDNTIMIDTKELSKHNTHVSKVLSWKDEQNQQEIQNLKKQLEEIKNAIAQKKNI